MKYLDNNLMCSEANLLSFIAEPGSEFSQLEIRIPALVFIVKENEITEEVTTIDGEVYQTLFVPIRQIKQDILTWTNADNCYKLENGLSVRIFFVIRRCFDKIFDIQVEFFENSLIKADKDMQKTHAIMHWDSVMSYFDEWKELS